MYSKYLKNGNVVFVKDTEHCLLIRTEKWRQCLDKVGGRREISGALLTDLLKAFDCLLHDLLIAKLATYSFDYDSLVFLQSYLSGRQQRTKVNNAYSTYSNILYLYGVPQGSILGPLIFNVLLVICFTILINAIMPAMLTTTHLIPVTLT